MALSEQEEFELLSLEREKAKSSRATKSEIKTPAPAPEYAPGYEDSPEWAKPTKQQEEKARVNRQELLRGMTLPFLGMAQSVPYEPLQKKATELVKSIPPEVERSGINPRTLGQAIPETLLWAMTPELKVAKTAGGLTKAATDILGTAGKGTALGGLTSTAQEESEIGRKKTAGAIETGLFTGALSSLPYIGRAGKALYDKVKTALSTEGKEGAEALAREVSTKAEPVVQQAQKTIEQEAKEAERINKAQLELSKRDPVAAQRQTQREQNIRTSLDALSNTKALPDEELANVIVQSGQKQRGSIRGTAQSEVIADIKDPMFQDSRSRYLKGDTIESNPESRDAFVSLIQTIDKEIENLPITEQAGLKKFRQGLLGEKGVLTEEQQWANNLLISRGQEPAFKVDKTPLSVDQAEYFRRMFNDKNWRAENGFATFSGKQMGRISEKLQEAVNAYDSRYKQYISGYAKSKQAEEAAFGSTEKFLEEIGGTPENKPKQVINYFFDGTKDAAERMVNFVGGKTPELVNAIKADFRTKMEGMSAKEAESFINKNQGLLQVFPELKDPMQKVALAKSVAEKAPVAAEKKAIASEKRLGTEEKLSAETRKKAEEIVKRYERPLDLTADRPAEETKTIVTKMFVDLEKDGVISSVERRLYDKRANDIMKKIKDAGEARQQLINLGMAAAKLAVPASATGALYYGYKSL